MRAEEEKSGENEINVRLSNDDRENEERHTFKEAVRILLSRLIFVVKRKIEHFVR